MNTDQLYKRCLQFIDTYNKLAKLIEETADSLASSLTNEYGDPYDRIYWDDLPPHVEDDLGAYKVLDRKALPLIKFYVQVIKLLEQSKEDKLAETLSSKLVDVSDNYDIKFLADNYNLNQTHLKLLKNL